MRASVIPLMIDPEFNVPFAILGRSRPVDSWVEGSLVWSDFGGHVKQGCTVEETASRELMEELCGTLISSPDISLFTQSLREQRYVLAYVSQTHVVFVVRFEWRPSLLFEFQTLHLQLQAFGRVSRGIPLTIAERMVLCRFRWMQSQSDMSLQRLVSHPAVQTRKQLLPASIVQQAASDLADAFGSAPRVLHMNKAVSCTVIDGVKSCFLEKDKIDMLSLTQLHAAFRPEGLTSGQGQSIVFSNDFLMILKAVVRALTTGLLCCEPSNQYEMSNTH